MKKMNVMTILILLIFISCSSLKAKKSETKIKKTDEKEIPVPEFNGIEKYIRTSYKDMNSDEIRRESFIADSPHLDLTLKELIIKGKIRIGMYKEEVYASIGKPENKIQNPTDFGMKEEWFYTNQICYFENGVLKNIEGSKK